MRKIRIDIFISFLFLFLRLSPMSAQEGDYFLGPQRFSFIDYEANSFQFPAADTVFNRLLNRFDSLILYGEGKIQVVHIGGSHIQADIYTHVMRTHLQSLSPDMNGGRGLIFPYRIAHTNNPSNYKVTYTGNWSHYNSIHPGSPFRLGITGLAVSTCDSLATIDVALNTSDSTNYTFDGINIYHDSSNYKVYAVFSDTSLKARYDSNCLCSRIAINRPESTLHLQLVKDPSDSDGSFTLQGIEFTSDASGVVYNSVGVNGATLSSYLRCELYRKQLQILDPDLIIISIGTNDGYTRRFDQNKFCTEYHELLNETIEAAPDAVLLLTVPNDDLLYRRYSNTNTEKIKNIIQDLAQEYKCGVWDFYTIMGGLNSAQIWYSQKLMQYDRIHFNRKGYQLQGELLFSAFLKAWENHLIEFEHRAYAGIDEMYIPGCIR